MVMLSICRSRATVTKRLYRAMCKEARSAAELGLTKDLQIQGAFYEFHYADRVNAMQSRRLQFGISKCKCLLISPRRQPGNNDAASFIFCAHNSRAGLLTGNLG
ncbi:hypothetical protein V2G26_006325 [Clonostachys chloroleuca]